MLLCNVIQNKNNKNNNYYHEISVNGYSSSYLSIIKCAIFINEITKHTKISILIMTFVKCVRFLQKDSNKFGEQII